jgi:hypothetical protein
MIWLGFDIEIHRGEGHTLQDPPPPCQQGRNRRLVSEAEEVWGIVRRLYTFQLSFFSFTYLKSSTTVCSATMFSGKKNLSNLEHLVMDVLWKRGPLSSEDVRLALEKKHFMKESTTRTILKRLEDKGYVRHTWQAEPTSTPAWSRGQTWLPGGPPDHRQPLWWICGRASRWHGEQRSR